MICISFIYTEKTVNLLRENDELMIKIKSASNIEIIKPVSAIVKENTIIPGISGVVIDEQKSYQNLKKIGSFTPQFLEYKKILPHNSINHNYDKYIIGANPSKRTVAINFVVKQGDNIDELLNIVTDENIKVNFFVEYNWLENNSLMFVNLTKQGHNVGILSEGYNNGDFVWVNSLVKKCANQKSVYCYNVNNDNNFLKHCTLQKSYTISPTVIIKNNPFIEVKSKLKSGVFISMPVNKKVIDEFKIIVKHIKSKGLNVENLNQILTE